MARDLCKRCGGVYIKHRVNQLFCDGYCQTEYNSEQRTIRNRIDKKLGEARQCLKCNRLFSKRMVYHVFCSSKCQAAYSSMRRRNERRSRLQNSIQKIGN